MVAPAAEPAAAPVSIAVPFAHSACCKYADIENMTFSAVLVSRTCAASARRTAFATRTVRGFRRKGSRWGRRPDWEMRESGMGLTFHPNSRRGQCSAVEDQVRVAPAPIFGSVPAISRAMFARWVIHTTAASTANNAAGSPWPKLHSSSGVAAQASNPASEE